MGTSGLERRYLLKALVPASNRSSEISSPSHLVNFYEGRLRLYHLDLYRLEGSETLELGLDEMLSEPDAVVIIEWGQRAAIKDPAYRVLISDL
jgi:tRNA threonylcarbamoyladenosine biosynthesis protein TsaE